MKAYTIIDDGEWDELVSKTYGKVYNFQQQDGCQDRGTVYFTVPCMDNDFKNDTVPEIVNSPEMGVSFNAWLARDPSQALNSENCNAKWMIDMYWQRNFYPSLESVANDLHKRGLLPAGDYGIKIDW